MDRKVEGNKNKENHRILRDQRERSSSDFVKIPIRVLKRDEYEATNKKKESDNIESIMKKYIQKPEASNKVYELGEEMSNKRTIPIQIMLEGTPKDKREQYNERKISIQIEVDQERKGGSKLQPSKNILPKLQPMSEKPPSGSQTLPTPRKYYHTRNERLGPRHGRESNTSIQLPFGGGQEFGNIKAELQVTKGKLSAQIDQITGDTIKDSENKWARSHSVEANPRASKESLATSGIRKEISLHDIDNDIETIWKEIKEFDETKPKKPEENGSRKKQSIYEWAQTKPKLSKSRQPTDYESIPLTAPPLPPKSRQRSSSLSMNLNNKIQGPNIPPSLPNRSTSLTRSSSMPASQDMPTLKPCLKPNSCSSSVTRGNRSRSNTPSTGSRVVFKDIGHTVTDSGEEPPADNPFEWVDFKKYEGLPRGIILPEDCVEEDIVDEKDNFSDDEEYFSAEENVEMEISCLSRDVATQTDPIMEISACIVM